MGDAESIIGSHEFCRLDFFVKLANLMQNFGEM